MKAVRTIVLSNTAWKQPACSTVSDVAKTVVPLRVHFYAQHLPPKWIRDVACGCLSRCSTLVDIGLYCCIKSLEEAADIADALRKSTSLAKLDVSGCTPTPEGVVALANALPSRLTTLDISYTDIRLPALVALQHRLARPRKLQRLNVGRTIIGPRGCNVLAKALVCLPLTHLNIGNNPIGDVAIARLIREIKNLALLESINIDGTGGSIHAAAALAELLATSTCRLRFVSAQYCFFDRAACETIASGLRISQSMHYADLQFSVSSFHGLRALLKQAPRSRGSKVEVPAGVVRDSIIWSVLPDRNTHIEYSRRMAMLLWKRATEAKQDSGMILKASSEGRPLELAKRLRLGKLAGGLERTQEVQHAYGRVIVGPMLGACLGGHADCVMVLLREGRGRGRGRGRGGALWPAGERASRIDAAGSGTRHVFWLEACMGMREGGGPGQDDAVHAILLEWADGALAGLAGDVGACKDAIEFCRYARYTAVELRGEADRLRESGEEGLRQRESWMRPWQQWEDKGWSEWVGRYGARMGVNASGEAMFDPAPVAKRRRVDSTDGMQSAAGGCDTHGVTSEVYARAGARAGAGEEQEDPCGLHLFPDPSDDWDRMQAAPMDDWYDYWNAKIRAEATEEAFLTSKGKAVARADKLMRGLKGVKEGILALTGGQWASESHGSSIPDDARELVHLGESAGWIESVEGVLRRVVAWASGYKAGSCEGDCRTFWSDTCDTWGVHRWVLPSSGVNLVDAEMAGK